MVHNSDFVCGTCEYIKCLASMPNLVGRFISGMYLTKTCKVDIVSGCVLAFMWKCQVFVAI